MGVVVSYHRSFHLPKVRNTSQNNTMPIHEMVSSPEYTERCTPPKIVWPKFASMKQDQLIRYWSWPMVAISTMALDILGLFESCDENRFWDDQNRSKEILIEVIRWRYEQMMVPFLEKIGQSMEDIKDERSYVSKNQLVTSKKTLEVATIGDILSEAKDSLQKLGSDLNLLYSLLEIKGCDMEFWDPEIDWSKKSYQVPTRDPRDIVLQIALGKIGPPDNQNKFRIPEALGFEWKTAVPPNLIFNNRRIPSPLRPAMQCIAIDAGHQQWVTGATQPKVEGFTWINDIFGMIREAQMGESWRQKVITSQATYMQLESSCIEDQKKTGNGRSQDDVLYTARLQAKAAFRHNAQFLDMTQYESIALTADLQKEQCCFRCQVLFGFQNLGVFSRDHVQRHVSQYDWARRQGNATACAECDIALQLFKHGD
jgi:hypothetical protein